MKDNSIIITPSTLKQKLIKELSKQPLKNIKVITLTELKEKYYFTYDEHAIIYLMNKYHYKFDVAKMYLSRLYEVENDSFNSTKIKKIIDLKKELIEQKLLIYTPNFINYLKNKTVYFYECTRITNLEKKLLKEISEITQTKFINEEKTNYKHQYVYEFDTIEEEITYIANEICKLIQEGHTLNQIKLFNVTGEYPSIIKRIFNWYNIPITFKDNYLYQTKIANDFLEKLDNNVTNAIKYIEENYQLTNQKNLEIYNQIIKILNKYIWIDSFTEIKELLIDEFKNTTINDTHYQQEIEIINDLSNQSTDNIIFLLGFNQGEIPKTFKDESYFNDTLKEKLGLETTKELNKISYQNSLELIKNTKNLIITTKKTSSLGEHYISSLNDDLNLEIKKPTLNYNYSNLHNKLLLGEKIDTFIKYGEKTKDLELLYSNYKNIPYQHYSNEYQNINKEQLKEYIKHNLTLSYSSMNTYYQCGFRYYLSNILKLNIFEETFYTILGNLFHYILSKTLQTEINIQQEYKDYLEKCTYPFNSREKYFLNKLQKELEFIIDTIKKQNETNSLTKTYYEENIQIDKSLNNINITFKGFVDKMMTNQNEDTIAIVDYKTGTPDLNLNNIIHGLDLQLPVYIYLARKKFPNINVAGFYLQKILNNEISKDYKHTYQDLKKDKLKLQGYSNSNIAILEQFDSSYYDSKVIKGMKTTSKGLGTKKVLNNEQIDKLEEITETKINEAIQEIINANFKINPKRIGMNNLGCKYCQFKDICFYTEKDIENKKEYKNMEFLGGEENDTKETN